MCEPKLIRTLNGDTRKPAKYASFGFSLGTYYDFQIYITGYIDAINQVYRRFDESSNDAIEVHDAIVYPFCFLCRHTVELCIKYLYIKYADVNTEKCEEFLNKNGHRLSLAWNATAHALQKLIDRFPSCGFDMKWFDAFITEIDTFDGGSFRMRYPITKKMQKTNGAPVLLDMEYFKEGISELLNQFMSFDNYFDNVLVNNIYSDTFWQRFSAEYQRCKCLLDRVIDITFSAIEEKKKDNKPTLIKLSDIQGSIKPAYLLELTCLVHDADTNQIATLMILLYTGRDLVYKRFKLSETAYDRAKDLITGLELTVSEGIDLSYDQPDSCKWIISSKLLDTLPQCIYQWMTTIRECCNELFEAMPEKAEEK